MVLTRALVAMCLVLTSAGCSNAPLLGGDSIVDTTIGPVRVGQARLIIKSSDTAVDLDAAADSIAARLGVRGVLVLQITPQSPDTVVVDVAQRELDEALELSFAKPEFSFRPVLEQLAADSPVPLTDDVASIEAVLAETGTTRSEVARYRLGPSVLGIDGVAGADAVEVQQSEWVVGLELQEGAEGIDSFNTVAGQCFAKEAECPTGQIALSINGSVLMAPTVNVPSFEKDSISISTAGGYEVTALGLATLLTDQFDLTSFMIESFTES